MRGTALAGGVAALALAVGATACTSGSGPDGDATDGKTGSTGTAAGPARPGTHTTLPEPCGAVGESLLRELLLQTADDTEGAAQETARAELPEGRASVTYDIDRRAGCQWKSSTALGSRHLTVDLERVVSYDGTVSDDDRAADLFDSRAARDGIPDEPPPTTPDAPEGTPSGSADPDDGKPAGEPAGKPSGKQKDGGQDPDETASGDDKPGATAPQGAATSAPSSPAGSEPAASTDPATDPALAPRPLRDIGDAAYLNDRLVTADAGLHRDITVVFRTGNVLVTVEYNEWSNDKRRTPGSEELQEKAQKLAKQLAARLDS
ncbi:hypothetical protein H3146_04490 [Streptomyces sp. OF3]|uniref:DUF3558 domain-containing protein n=1 Tax=Streptomyces alkaliterrae TaxID=2213162 RepID=A0A7W3WHX7_9ACTN|nr:hypothetical protein [Streptomyces alkaliterrae]MBB1252629.1 hypothetical protein [Streptomyces alkaliterrae]